MKSIIQDTKECYVTGCTEGLHEHHIFYGNGVRPLSEKYGLKIWLRADFHNMSDYGIHFNKEFDLDIKQMGQKVAMEHYDLTTDDFIKIFGRNYIE